MFLELAYYPILGKSLIFWMGIITYLLLVSSAIMGHLFLKGKLKSALKIHLVLSTLTILFATFHAVLGISTSF